MTRSASSGPATSRAGRVGEPDGGLRPGQVERDQRGALARPAPEASTAYSATPSAPSRGDQQVVGGTGVDHPLDGRR